ncbi:phosphatase PAP2 family protein [Halohasta salina]|uniref:phosphatase PAP2 family protein n=1 Tax=Halohasta salina TaxID=2961621 RepID=UPI0020A308FA|nr:phosphatase PAP2 family protein [Halohasta salina]
MLRALVFEVSVVVAALCAVGAVTIVGRTRLTALRVEIQPRLRESAPYLAVLIAVLALNSAVRDYAQEISWFIGLNITDSIEAIEGGFVAAVQSVQTELLTAYFSYVYVFGYVFLLIFPLLAYAALDDRTPFKRLVVAYSFNYLLGLLLYIVFVAYGPRNVGVAENLLYITNPEYQFLTSAVNTNTNVFPSLHTSLSATVAVFAYRTREAYPIWFGLAIGLAASIILSTMYLGIHWGTDVLVGLGLAALCVGLSRRYVDGEPSQSRVSSESKSSTGITE